MTTSKTIAGLIGPTLVAIAASILLNIGSFPALADRATFFAWPRPKADLRGIAAPGAERKLRSDRVCPQADNATSPRGLCFSAVVLCLLIPSSGSAACATS
jgi:hypothetical protein